MFRAKRWFITPYLLGVTAATAVALIVPWLGHPAWGALLLGAGPVTWLTVVHTLRPRRARTPRRYPSLVVLAALGVGAAAFGWPDLGPLLTSLVLFAGLLVYLYWYSEFDLRRSRYLRVGDRLPVFSAWEAGRLVTSEVLGGRPALILFYRGNWCPVCTAQIDELARSYQALSARGIEVVLVSPQPDGHTQEAARRINLPFRFWEDRGNRAAAQLEIVDPDGLPLGMEALGYGKDTPVPTALLLDGEGRIVYADQAENYRLRPEPQAYLDAWDRRSLAGSR